MGCGSSSAAAAADPTVSQEHVAIVVRPNTPAVDPTSTAAATAAALPVEQLAPLRHAFLRASGGKSTLNSEAEFVAALRILNCNPSAADAHTLFSEAQADGSLDLAAFVVILNRRVAHDLRTAETATSSSATLSVPSKAPLVREPSSLQFAVTPEHLMAYSDALQVADHDGFVRSPLALQQALAALGKEVDAVEAAVLYDVGDKGVYEEGSTPCIGLTEFASLCAKIGVDPLAG